MQNSLISVCVKHLIDVEEYLLVELISQLGLSKTIDMEPHGLLQTDSKDFLEEVILKKMFCASNRSTSTERVLENKYLYYLSGGAIGYLDAIYSMDYDKAIENDTKNLRKLLSKDTRATLGISSHKYDLVSIGSGDGKKDIRILEVCFSNKDTDDIINYYPIDFSPFLLQLNINNFAKRFGYSLTKKRDQPTGKFEIHPINADFLTFSKDYIREEIKNIFRGSNRPKIFMILGSTIGNYREDLLVDSIKGIMSNEDLLIINFEIYKDETDLEATVRKYFTSGNVEFLSNPIRLIPHLSGFLENKTKYFNIYETQFTSDTEKTLSIFSNSRVYKPTLKIPILDNPDYVIAWTTRYDKDSLSREIESNLKMQIVKYTEGEGNYMVLLKKNPKGDGVTQCSLL